MACTPQMSAAAAERPAGSRRAVLLAAPGRAHLPGAPEMRGAWVGFSWGHTQAHFFRAILESVAYEYAYYLGILRELLPDLALVEARAVGGGARSPVWNQIKADVLGVPYQRLAAPSSAPGARDDRRQGGGAVRRPGRDGARTTLPEGEPVRPREAEHAAYRPLVERYVRLQADL